MAESTHVAVVGGGVAGIAAALACADGGARVSLLEVRPRLGGAAYSFERDGVALDNGQHVFLRCCVAYRALLERLGSTSLVEVQPRLDIPVLSPGKPDYHLRRSGLPAPAHLTGALLRYPHLSRRERFAAVRAALALRRLRDPADVETLGAWLTRHHQSARSIAALWDLIALPTLNVPADQASLALGAFVFQRGLLSDSRAGDVGIHRAPLSEILDLPARRTLEAAGVAVHLGSRVREVSVADDGFLLRGDSELHADRVVVAVPHDRAAAILPRGATEGHAWPTALGKSSIINVHLTYDRQIFDHVFAAGVGTPVQYLFDRSAGQVGLTDGAQQLAISLSGADAEMELTPAELRARYVPALEALLPRARAAQLLRFSVTREHAATFRAEPGVELLRPPAATAIKGLALAGSWTATGWPATLEGAALSGEAAAAHILARRPRLSAKSGVLPETHVGDS